MGWWNSEKKAKKLLRTATVVESFHIVASILLSLLLPLSFLLLSRFFYASYLFTITATPCSFPPSLFLYFSLIIIPSLLYVLVSAVSIATVVHGLTGKITFASEFPDPIYRPRLSTAWIILCVLQVCVCLGIEGSIEAEIKGTVTNFGAKRSLLSKVAFFLGLHETMLLWSRVIVKPVVDDTIFKVAREERWVQRVVLAVSLGSFWWWKLRDGVDGLVVAVESKTSLMGIEPVDFLGWWLYYATVTIGMVRVVKALMWLGMVLLFETVRIQDSDDYEQTIEDEEKV
ncbi:hypothetical protein SLE2022_331690 [Rubroshorea leprosula]